MTQLYRIEKAAELMDIARTQVYELINTEQLAWVNLATRPEGRPRLRIHRTEIERFIKNRTVPAKRAA